MDLDMFKKKELEDKKKQQSLIIAIKNAVLKTNKQVNHLEQEIKEIKQEQTQQRGYTRESKKWDYILFGVVILGIVLCFSFQSYTQHIKINKLEQQILIIKKSIK